MSKKATEFELDLMMNRTQIYSIQNYNNNQKRSIDSLCIKSVGKPEHAGLLTIQSILDKQMKIIDEARYNNSIGILVDVDSMLNKMYELHPVKDEVSKLNEFMEKRMIEVA